MKLLVQIPCYNEEMTLPLVLESIPTSIPGVSTIETVVIDDGSSDKTSTVARESGATYIVKNTMNLGLAFSFRRGLDTCLAKGADIIVNLDGDNQYNAADIPKIIEPLLRGEADIVIGDRHTDDIPHFSPLKKFLQRVGSSIVRKLSKTEVQDVVSGFRAFTRDAALKTTVLSNYSYTIESILQARTKGLRLTNVVIRTNPKTRESRLMKSLGSYLAFSVATIIRVFTMYNPLRVFVVLGACFFFLGAILVTRFLIYYFATGGAGHIQSLIVAAICVIVGATVMLAGLLADLIQFNRRLLEDVLERVKKLELKR